MLKVIRIENYNPKKGEEEQHQKALGIFNEFTGLHAEGIVKEIKNDYYFKGTISGIRLCTEIGHSLMISERVSGVIYLSRGESSSSIETCESQTVIRNYGGRRCWITIFGPRRKGP
jgi:hypothetical protein